MDKPKILIVEDERDTIETIQSCLERAMGCQVYASESGEDAISKINQHDFDLVILDLKMPGLSGLDVMKQVKKEKALPDVLVITGWDSAQIATQVIQEGAIDYIPKPIVVDTLKLKVKDILTKKGKYTENT